MNAQSDSVCMVRTRDRARPQPHAYRINTTERGDIIRSCTYCGHAELSPRTLEA